MKKTILIGMAMTFSLNAMATAQTYSEEQLDRVSTIAAKTNEERQDMRKDLVENLEQYKTGLTVIMKDLDKHIEERNEAGVKAVMSALASLAGGLRNYLTIKRVTPGNKSLMARVIEGTIALGTLASSFSTSFHGTQAVLSQIEKNNLQEKVDVLNKNISDVQAKLEIIKDLEPKN